MKSPTILKTGITATTAMTLFSYIISNAKKKNFREPDVLSQLIQRLPPGHSKFPSDLAGWIMHYAIGIIFVAIYIELWKETKTKPSVASGMLLGGLSGLAGIMAWKGMFQSHPNPPSKNLKQYFGHLILAHLIFGLIGAVTYKTLNDKYFR